MRDTGIKAASCVITLALASAGVHAATNTLTYFGAGSESATGSIASQAPTNAITTSSSARVGASPSQSSGLDYYTAEPDGQAPGQTFTTPVGSTGITGYTLNSIAFYAVDNGDHGIAANSPVTINIYSVQTGGNVTLLSTHSAIPGTSPSGFSPPEELFTFADSVTLAKNTTYAFTVEAAVDAGLAIVPSSGGTAGQQLVVIDPSTNTYHSYTGFTDRGNANSQTNTNFTAYSGSNVGSGLDQTVFQVDATAITPEPASLGLLSLGMIGLLARRRRA